MDPLAGFLLGTAVLALLLLGVLVLLLLWDPWEDR